jgi:CBS domain containing-hemolysin-like protein
MLTGLDNTAPAAMLVGRILLMLALLAGSAFFSGTETAFFNLSRRQRDSFRRSGHGLQRLAALILDEPRRLLGCLLLGNMAVNVLYFAAASVLAMAVGRYWGLAWATAVAVTSLVAQIIFGEIVPKSLAYNNSPGFSVAAALPMTLFVKVLGPVQGLFRTLFVEPLVRLILGTSSHPGPITAAEFRSLLDRIRKSRRITDDQGRLLSEIVEFGFLKVRDVMKPRVDIPVCALTDPPRKAVEIMLDADTTKLPVYSRSIDNIVGFIYLRELLLNPGTALWRLVRKVHFVPEQKRLESLLVFFRKSGTDSVMVVDEYGGIAGLVRLEDIAEELFGPVEPADHGPEVEQLGPLRYRLSGDLPIHEWSQAFGIDRGTARFSTIGGLVTSLLGKVPRAGDVAELENLRFIVETVRKRRVESVILVLKPIETNV